MTEQEKPPTLHQQLSTLLSLTFEHTGRELPVDFESQVDNLIDALKEAVRADFANNAEMCVRW